MTSKIVCTSNIYHHLHIQECLPGSFHTMFRWCRRTGAYLEFYPQDSNSYHCIFPMRNICCIAHEHNHRYFRMALHLFSCVSTSSCYAGAFRPLPTGTEKGRLMPHGRGTMSFADGSTYTCTWEDGRPAGAPQTRRTPPLHGARGLPQTLLWRFGHQAP